MIERTVHKKIHLQVIELGRTLDHLCPWYPLTSQPVQWEVAATSHVIHLEGKGRQLTVRVCLSAHYAQSKPCKTAWSYMVYNCSLKYLYYT